MTLAFIILLVWALYATTKARAKAIQQQEFDRIKQEQARRAKEQAQIRQELKKQQAAAKAESARLIAVEREQERQAKQLARHEEQLIKLEQQMMLADREIAHFKPIADQLRREQKSLSAKVDYYESIGLPCGGYKTQLEKVNDKLYRTETQIIKAEFAKSAAQKKMTA